MKKLVAGILVAVLLLSSFSVIAFAEEYVTVVLNGQTLEFDVPAQIIDDRTMVPMRKIFESLGADVTWIEKNQVIIATKGSKIIAMAINSDVMLVTDLETGKEDRLTLDVPPMLVDDRTLVPLRAISESLGCNVEWNEAEQTVYITK